MEFREFRNFRELPDVECSLAPPLITDVNLSCQYHEKLLSKFILPAVYQQLHCRVRFNPDLENCQIKSEFPDFMGILPAPENSAELDPNRIKPVEFSIVDYLNFMGPRSFLVN
ncbi:MAG: hypothetical protein KKG70_01505 [Proteobacteria bacterium]|nr:hypothetical protein [Pseudomonadota bacterium]